MIGRTLGRYEIIETIGEGGMGTVYTARDSRLNRFVAIKLPGDASAERKARFLQEAQAPSALNHAGVWLAE